MEYIKTLDISKHQVSFAPAKSATAGIDSVAVRHCYGATADAMALGWAAGIHKAGLPLGGYGFATWHYKSVNGGNTETARAAMRKQVAAWIAQAQYAGTDWWFGIDQELERGQTMGLGKSDNTAIINEAAALLRDAGLHPVLYCSISWDMAWIRTADLTIDYWLARYYDGAADFGDAGADIAQLPDGQYTRWMQQLQAAGRLVGWQYGSTGHGAQYGVGSDNVDRSVFYRDPDTTSTNAPVEAPATAAYIVVGPMSDGDAATVGAELDRLCIGYTAYKTDDGLTTIHTGIAVSAGDQASVVAMAASLSIGVQLQDVPPEVSAGADPSGYSVVFVGMAIKGGFASAADAKDYIESVLGKDAMERLGMVCVEA